MEEMSGVAVPEFGTMLSRVRLMDLFESQSPPLTLVCAAAGYGKTVLASQLARSSSFDATLWVQLPDIDVGGDVVLRQVAESLQQDVRYRGGLIAETVRSVESAVLDDSIRIHNRLQQYLDSAVLLVVDGANSLSGLDTLTSLAKDLGRYTSPQSRIVVTCRKIDHDEPLDPGEVWLLEEGDLAFDLPEVRALVSSAPGLSTDDDANRLFASYLGHPALTRIMLRHGIPASDAQPRDLIWQTERIVSRLGETEIAALYLAAVLGEGDLVTLNRCAVACDLSLDWLALSRSVPLFCVFNPLSRNSSFRVHSVLSDVLERFARTAVNGQDRSSLRAIAFEQLSQDREFLRLANALESHGEEEEVAYWCQKDGVSFLRHAGHSVVNRLQARLSPLSIASSAQLLLLRAHVQRAGGALSAALESAMMAKRVAEVSEDERGLVAAILLVARLQFDRGMIAETQSMLEGVEVAHRANGDSAARCLTQAYLAVSDGQAGRLHEAAERLKILSQIFRSLDPGSDEAVFVANCMASVACDCVGDWRTAASILAPIVRRTDVASLQQVHVRSNYAVALFELGDLRTAATRAEAAVGMCEKLGIKSILPYAAATLTVVSWMRNDLERAHEVNALAVINFERSQDQIGLATHGINSARVLRALGEVEESLSCGIGAESLLAGHGASVHMLGLMASIEVAASHLALGDVSLAVTAIERVLADPVIPEALGHSLRCDLVLAQVDLIRGHGSAAINRLSRHVEYIRGGSANMTLVCYIRAFPGLLGSLHAALGTPGVPARVVRLLPADTVEEAVVRTRVSMGAEVAAAIQARYLDTDPHEHRGIADKPLALQSAPRLKVRAFGKLEIESPYGRVEHRHWRKRKSRLLFLMLLCAPAHEIPRDVVLERLWPEMDHGNAQRNLYVTWSHMRKALTCEAVGANVGQFAESNSDSCWLTSALESDVDQFRAELGVLSAARIAGDAAAVISSTMRLNVLYRGDLLPMDIYEEWFEEDRTRARRDFCDAMVTGAQCAVESEKHDVAMVFLKRVSAIDPWREDVYQLMMRCQMVAGQRSRAIETYNLCRTRLVDDLGIDPCAETVRIFQAVLAMEDLGSSGASQTDYQPFRD